MFGRLRASLLSHRPLLQRQDHERSLSAAPLAVVVGGASSSRPMGGAVHRPAPALVALATVALAAVACGGSAPPAEAPSAPVATAPAEPPVDLSAVEEPSGLLVVGRVSKPAAVVKTAGTWSRLPLPGATDLVRSISDDSVADAIDLTQPVDGALVLAGKRTPEPLAAFSVAVRSFDDAKAKLGARHKLTKGANGQFIVEGIGASADARDGDDEDEQLNCVLAPASSGARLVCGPRPAVELLTPYLTRTVPRKDWPADVHVELHPEPIRAVLKDVRQQVPILARSLLGTQSPALGELATATVAEVADFADDARRVTFDAQISDPGAKADVRIEYGSAKSFMAKVAAAGRGKGGPAPAAFWHLPAETDVAYFGNGTDPKLYDRPRELLANVLIESMQDGGLPESERKAVRELVVDRMTSLFTGAAVYGKGYDAAAVDKAVSARKSVKAGDLAASDEAERVLAEQAVGWHLVQVGEPIAKVGPILKDWSALWNRPAFAAWAKKRASSKMVAQMRIAPAPAGAKLPKDAVHLEIVMPRTDLEVPAPKDARGAAAKPKKIARKAVTLHLLAVPDQGATWIGFGLDPKLLAQKAATVLSSAPETDTLKEKTVLGDLQNAKLSAGGLVTLRGLVVLSAVDGHDKTYSALGTLPSKGATPVVFTGLSEPPSTDAPAGSVVSSFRIPRAAIEDIIRMTMNHR